MQNGQITGAQPKKKMKGWKVAVISVVSAVVVLGAASGIAYAASDTVRFFIKHNSLWTYTNAQSHPIAKWS